MISDLELNNEKQIEKSEEKVIVDIEKANNSEHKSEDKVENKTDAETKEEIETNSIEIPPSAKKRKHLTIEEEESIKAEMEKRIKLPMEDIYHMCINKESAWKEEFQSFISNYIKVDPIEGNLPQSLNEEGSFLLTLPTFWVLLFKMSSDSTVQENIFQNKDHFLALMNNATDYPMDNKLLLVEFFIKTVDDLFSKEEILSIINSNPLVKEKKQNVYEVSKDDYKYILSNPDFFTILLMPRMTSFSGKKQKQSESRNSLSAKKSESKAHVTPQRSVTSQSSAGKQKFQVDIDYPEEVADHQQNKPDLSFQNIHNLQTNIEPIKEEKNEDEVTTNNPLNKADSSTRVNADLHLNANLSQSNSKSKPSFTFNYIDRERPNINLLKQEIIDNTILTVDRTEFNLRATKKEKPEKPAYTSARSHSFTIQPNKKRLSFVNNYSDSNKEEIEESGDEFTTVERNNIRNKNIGARAKSKPTKGVKRKNKKKTK